MVKSFWQDRSVLVTGASGLVGGWLVKRLLGHGADIVCLVRDWVPQSELVLSSDLSRVKVVRGDIRDRDCIERSIGEHAVETVFHLAAQTIVSIAKDSPSATFDSNIRGTWNVLEACRLSDTVGQLVLASSDKAYGDAEGLPYTEDMPLAGRHPYDVSKSCADLISRCYFETYGLPVCITRCGNFFGGGDLNFNRIVPGTIRSILRGERPVIRSNGKYIRDYFYVEDGASAYMHVAEHMESRPQIAGEAFNLSNGSQVTVSALVELILRLMNSSMEPDIRDTAVHEIQDQFLSCTKAQRTLGWAPEFSLDDAMTKTISWYERYLSGAE